MKISELKPDTYVAEGIYWDGVSFFVTCPDCGREQGDMGRHIMCEDCGYGPMPTAEGMFEE